MVFWEGSLHLEDEVPKCILLLPKNTEMFIPLFFWGPPFFKGWIAVSPPFFLRMEGAQGGPKKGGCIPLFFLFFLWIASSGSSGTFKRGITERGVFALLASRLSLRAVGPATVLSHKCDTLPLLKDNQIVRDNRLPVQCRHLASRQHRTVILVATQMSLPSVCLPPV